VTIPFGPGRSAAASCSTAGRWSESTLSRRIKGDRLAVLPREPGEPVRILGQDILKLLGERMPVPPGETRIERRGRATRARDEARRLAKDGK
jgi:hypothetical protein